MEFDLMLFLALAVGAGALAVRDALLTRLLAMLALLMAGAVVAVSGVRLDAMLGLAALLACTGFRLRLEMKYRMQAQLTAEERVALSQAFPTMHSRDWEILLRHAERLERKQGEALIERGAQTCELSVVFRGQVEERQINGSGTIRCAGAMWGELSFCAGQMYAGFPFTIRVTSDEAVVMRWSYETLTNVSMHRPRLRAALLEGFVRAAGMRQGLVVDVPVDALRDRLGAVSAEGGRLQLEPVARSA